MEYDTNTRIEECELMSDALDEIQTDLLNMDIEQMILHCDKEGINTRTYAELIDEMYWDGHSVFDIKQQIQVLEGNCSI